jgi:putative transposase
MARQVRIEYPGAHYHVMARGDRREPIVEDDADREDFLLTLGRACSKTGWRVHAWVLMTNHYHWLIETPEPNLVQGMKWFQNTFTRRFNVRRKRWGHVFGGRYKAVLLDPDDAGGYYFESLIDYIHLNPARAGIVDPSIGLGLLEYRWSSLRTGYAAAASSRPSLDGNFGGVCGQRREGHGGGPTAICGGTRRAQEV